MESRISIKANFALSTPYILVELDRESTDTRDEILRAFFEKLGYESNWCIVDFLPHPTKDGEKKHIHIFPISPAELDEQRALMAKRTENYKKGLEGIAPK